MTTTQAVLTGKDVALIINLNTRYNIIWKQYLIQSFDFVAFINKNLSIFVYLIFYWFYLNPFPYNLIHFINIFIYLFLNYCSYVNIILSIVSYTFFLYYCPQIVCSVSLISLLLFQYNIDFSFTDLLISFSIFQIDFFVKFTSFFRSFFPCVPSLDEHS